MKKIITMLLVAAGTISFASAQSHNQKDIPWNDNKKMNNDRDDHDAFEKGKNVDYNDSYFSYKEKMAKLEKIDREFDRKIDAVKFNRRLSGREKGKQIQFLQMQKQKEINQVEYDYAKSKQQGRDKVYGHGSH
ncbi:hypothetical protein [Ferruginibacter sp. SUN106]|uniref:hypothetical protein n=1 Tax=Ferruginibacter sp. SUN106 TaxID=2978348 RepID=UPI003D361DB7